MSSAFSPLAHDGLLCQKNQTELQTGDQMTHYREMGYDMHKYNWVEVVYACYAYEAQKDTCAVSAVSPTGLGPPTCTAGPT